MPASGALSLSARHNPRAGRIRLAVRPAPPREPPFDDEPGAPRLTLVGHLDRELPFESTAGTEGRPARNPAASAADAVGLRALPEPRSIPDPTAFSRRLVIAIIEVATGRRSAGQLSPYTARAVQNGLTRDAGRLTRLGTQARPAQVHSVHVGEPSDGVAEVAAVVRTGNRFRAVAFRLEASDGRWRCVRLQIG